MELRFLRGTERTHHVVALIHHQLLEGQHQQGTGHDDDRQGGGHVGVDGTFRHVLVIDQYRQNRVALAQQHRRTEVRKAGHEHHDTACKDGGQNDRQGDGPDAAQLAHTQVFRRLLQRAVYAVHGTGGVQIDVGEQMQGEYKDDAAPAVDRGRGGSKQSKELSQKSVAAHENDPGILTDKGRAHQAHDDKDVQNLFAGDVVPGHQIGDGNADDRCGQHSAKTDHHGADQSLVVVGLGKEADKVIQGEPLHLIGEHALGQYGVKRIDNEKAHNRDHNQLGEKPEIRLPPVPGFDLH